MRHFSVNLGIRDDNKDVDVSSRTLMIAGIPDTYWYVFLRISLYHYHVKLTISYFSTKEFVHRHISEAYQDEAIVEEVQVAYDVSKLSWLDQKRDNALKARMYCENHAAKFGAGQQMKPVTCGIMCMACNCRGSCCQDPVDALTFYKKEEKDFADEVLREKARIKTKSIGIAFVTFSRLSDAKQMLKDHQGRCKCFSNPSSSTLSNLLEPWNWSVRVAPPPEDIYWENLNESHRFFFLKTFIINLFLFIFLFFFTSPSYIISELEIILHLKDLNIKLPDKINDFLPTLLLWTLTALLPIIVAYSDWWMGHWRRSVENLWIMRKVFFYLLCMVLILPSVGLTSLKVLLEDIIESAQSNSTTPNVLKWNCIFLPDNGAFFVNYVITSALVGTALEFMRFSELFMYAMRLMFARSVAEVPNVRAANLYEFPFGFNYGWMLLIFALTVAYGVVCPLITPFGLFYLVMKHGVDRYNLFYAYKRSKINKNIHATAVNCVIVSLLIQQLILLFFNVVRGKSSPNSTLLNPKAIFSITMFTIFLGLFAVQFFFHIFKGWSPIQYTSQGNSTQGNTPNDSGRGSREDVNGGDANQPPERQFVGFCNPQDQEMDAPAGGQNGIRRRRHKDHKKYLPEVLKDDDEEDQHLPQVRSGDLHNGAHSSNNMVNSDSATFAYPEVNEPIRSSSPSYGALE